MDSYYVLFASLCSLLLNKKLKQNNNFLSIQCISGKAQRNSNFYVKESCGLLLYPLQRLEIGVPQGNTIRNLPGQCHHYMVDGGFPGFSDSGPDILNHKAKLEDF